MRIGPQRDYFLPFSNMRNKYQPLRIKNNKTRGILFLSALPSALKPILKQILLFQFRIRTFIINDILNFPHGKTVVRVLYIKARQYLCKLIKICCKADINCCSGYRGPNKEGKSYPPWRDLSLPALQFIIILENLQLFHGNPKEFSGQHHECPSCQALRRLLPFPARNDAEPTALRKNIRNHHPSLEPAHPRAKSSHPATVPAGNAALLPRTCLLEHPTGDATEGIVKHDKSASNYRGIIEGLVETEGKHRDISVD